MKIVRPSHIIKFVLSLGLCCSVSFPAIAQTVVLDGKAGNVQVTIVEQSPSVADAAVEVRNGSIDTAFTLEGPPRLVVDIKLASPISAKTMALAHDSQIFKGVRLGASPGKLRVVFDLKPATLPKVVTTNGAQSALFHVGEGEGVKVNIPVASNTALPSPVATVLTKPSALPVIAATAVPTRAVVMATAVPTATAVIAPTSTRTAIPTKTAVPTRTPKPTITPVPTRTPKHQLTTVPLVTATAVPAVTLQPTAIPTIAQTSTPAPEMTVVAGTLVLQKVLFETTGPEQSGVVHLVLSRKAEVRMNKLDERSFEFLIPKCGVAGRYVLLPYFPPEEFSGVTYVKAQVKPDTLQVIVGVNRGVRLTPLVRDQDVLIKVQD